MKTLLRLGWVFALLCFRGFAADGSMPPNAMAATDQVAAVTAADDERIAAMTAGDRARLEAILSDELHYGHSNGKTDTKASLIESLASRRSVYEKFEYGQRRFTPASAGIVLMTGRVIVHVRNGEQQLALDLGFLAVWRHENGKWRFLAWQSCRNPAPAGS